MKAIYEKPELVELGDISQLTSVTVSVSVE